MPLAALPALAQDAMAPSLSTAAVDGATLELTYDEALNVASRPATTDFTVTIAAGTGLTPTTASQNPTNVAIHGSAVGLTLGTPAMSGQTVTVTYTAGTNPIEDLARNDAANLSGRSVTNNTALVSSFGIGSGTVESTSWGIEFAQAFTTGSRATSLSRVELSLAIRAGSTPPPYTVSIHAADASGNPGSSVGTLTNPSSINPNVAATANFTAPSSGITLAGGTTYFVVLDVTGGTAASRLDVLWQDTTSDAERAGATTGWSIANQNRSRQHDATAWGSRARTALIAVHGAAVAPTPSKAAVYGGTLELTFNATLDTNSTPAAAAFTVTVAGTGQTSTNVRVSGSAVTLTLGTPVTHGQTVTVSYDTTAAGTDRLRDTGATPLEVASFTGQAVDASPVLVANSTPNTTESQWLARDYAQQFTTGSHATSLSEVELDLARTGSAGEPPYTVSIHATEASGLPGASLGTLSNSDAIGSGFRTYRFTAPSGGIALAGSTKYYVILDVTGGTAPQRNASFVNRMTGNAELAGAAPGWSIADGSLDRGYSATTWSVADHADPRSIVIAVHGAALLPTVVTAGVNGATLALTFNATLDMNATPAAAAFTVTAGSGIQTPTNVRVSGSAVTLTLGTAVTHGQTVRVSYNKANAGTTPLRDTGATPIEVASFTNQMVTNNTPMVVVPTVTISGGAAVTEGAAAAFTLTANPAPSSDLTVSLTVSEAAGSDYVAAGDEGSKTVTISSGSATASYAVTTQADSNDEPNGSVTVALGTGTGYTVGAPSSASVTVRDDDGAPNSPPVFTNQDTTASVAENSPGGTHVVTVAATDADNDPLAYSLDSASAAVFAIGSGGEITVRAGAVLDHETRPSYTTVVTANDGSATATHTVTISVTNVDEPPAAPPARGTLTANPAGSLAVSWRAPANSGPAISGYDVEYRRAGTAAWSDAGFSGTGTSTTIAGLTAGATYEVRVRARNADGPGPWSPLGPRRQGEADSDRPAADPQPLQLALWTERPGYRPGDSVRLYYSLDPHDDRGRYRAFVYLERAGGGRRRWLAPLSASGQLHDQAVDRRGVPASAAEARILYAVDRELAFEGPAPGPGLWQFVLELRPGSPQEQPEQPAEALLTRRAWAKFAVGERSRLLNVRGFDREIREDLTLRGDTVYYLQHQLFVHAGATLAIEPGTVVQAWGRQAAIIVLPGGQIVAEGTRRAPVVLTCSEPAGLLGRAAHPRPGPGDAPGGHGAGCAARRAGGLRGQRGGALQWRAALRAGRVRRGLPRPRGPRGGGRAVRGRQRDGAGPRPGPRQPRRRLRLPRRQRQLRLLRGQRLRRCRAGLAARLARRGLAPVRAARSRGPGRPGRRPRRAGPRPRAALAADAVQRHPGARRALRPARAPGGCRAPCRRQRRAGQRPAGGALRRRGAAGQRPLAPAVRRRRELGRPRAAIPERIAAGA
ncbi:MAG: hypothetical protein F4X12_03440 [Acidobacteriia bacterium]|nr:hypothetical protein [Terriglobia bacterium]